MATYTQIENAIVQKLITYYSDKLDATRVIPGKPDEVLTAMFEQDAKYGILFEFGGGFDMNRAPMNKTVWTWRFDGVWIIRYTPTVEDDLRSILDTFPTIFESDIRLGGVTPKVSLINIGQAEPTEINNTPFYWIPFAIEAMER